MVLVGVLLILPFASAAVITVNPVNATSNQIFFEQTAQYQISITNTGDTDRLFTWQSNPVEWMIDSSASGIVPAGEQRIFPLHIRPRPSNFKQPGFYVIPLTFTSQSETFTSQANLRILSTDHPSFSYTPSVALGASISQPVNPSELASVQVQLRNRNRFFFENATLVIDGTHFSSTESLTLGELEERGLEFRFSMANDVPPGSYPLVVQFVYDGRTISEEQRIYDVGSFSRVSRDTRSDSSWFRTVTVHEVTNDGNILKDATINLDVSFFNSLFTSLDIQANAKERVSRGVYTLDLDPQEVAVITVVQNYRAIPIIFIAVILGVLAYFKFRSPIVLQKQTIVTGRDQEGISEMRVRIFIRNRTAKSFFNVRVLDKAPSIAQVLVKEALGVLEPSDIIRSEKKGTVVKWDFETLESYEERIVTYTIKARLKIIGTIGLPPVQMKFEDVKGNQFTTSSGKAVIGAKN